MAKKVLRGRVVSDKGDKSIVVSIEYQKRDKKFEKIIRRSKKLMAHDENNTAKVGDLVVIQESRPYSKRKSFVLVEVKERAETIVEAAV